MVGARVGQPAQRQHRAVRVELGRVVEDHVEHHLEAGGVQRVDRLGELVGRARAWAAARVARLGGEPGCGRIAPVVGEATALQRRLVGAEVQGQQAQRGDAERAVVLEHQRVGEGGVAAAQRRRDVRVAHRQRTHVGLVEYRALARDVRAGRAVIRRSRGGGGHPRLGGEGSVVARVGQARIVAAGGAERGEPCRELHIVGCSGLLAAVAADHLLRPGVEQQLRRVEPVAAPWRPRAMSTQAIHQADPAGRQKAMPDAFAARRQRQAAKRLAACGIEKTELDRFGVRRPHREVHPGLAAVCGEGGTERPRLPRAQVRIRQRMRHGERIRCGAGPVLTRSAPVLQDGKGVGVRGAHRCVLLPGHASRRVSPRVRTSPRPAAAGAG